MRRIREESGATLIEMLVAITLIGVVTTGFYTVMLSGTRSSTTARDIARVTEEARLGFNRMVRDTREAKTMMSATPTSFRIHTDFDQNNSITAQPNPNANGDYEDVSFAWNQSSQRITLNGETLVSGVDCVRGSNGNCSRDVFQFISGRLEFDWNNDGITTWRELDEAGCASRGSYAVGNCQNPAVLDVELAEITAVEFAIEVSKGDRTTAFFAEAQLRNNR